MAERNLALTPPYQEIAFCATQALADVTSGQMGRYSTDLQAAHAQDDRKGIGAPHRSGHEDAISRLLFLCWST